MQNVTASYLQNGTRLGTRVHDDAPTLECADAQDQLQLAPATAVRHTVLYVAVP